MSIRQKDIIKDFIWNLCTNDDIKASQLLKQISGYKIFEKYIKQHRLEIIFSNFLRRNSLKINKNIKNIIEVANKNLIRAMINMHTSFKIAKHLNGKVNYAFLKGITFMNSSNPSMRAMRDIDILVSHTQLRETVTILEKIGFHFKNKNDFSSRMLIEERDLYDLPVMVNDEGVNVEIHYRIFSETKSLTCKMSKKILENIEATTFKNNEIRQATIELRVLHLIYHASLKGNFNVGASSIYDLICLLNNENKIDFKKLMQLATEFNIEKITICYLKLVNKKLNKEVYTEQLSNVTEGEIDNLKELILMPLYNKKIVDFFMIKKIKNKINYIFSTLFVPSNIAQREFNDGLNRNFIYLKRWVRQLRDFGFILMAAIFNQKDLSIKAKRVKYFFAD